MITNKIIRTNLNPPHNTQVYWQIADIVTGESYLTAFTVNMRYGHKSYVVIVEIGYDKSAFVVELIKKLFVDYKQKADYILIPSQTVINVPMLGQYGFSIIDKAGNAIARI